MGIEIVALVQEDAVSFKTAKPRGTKNEDQAVIHKPGNALKYVCLLHRVLQAVQLHDGRR